MHFFIALSYISTGKSISSHVTSDILLKTYVTLRPLYQPTSRDIVELIPALGVAATKDLHTSEDATQRRIPSCPLLHRQRSLGNSGVTRSQSPSRKPYERRFCPFITDYVCFPCSLCGCVDLASR